MLAGLIQAPESLNPIKHPDAAARRRSEVLDAMVSNNKTTAAKARAAKSVPLPTHLSYPHSTRLDYYLDEVRNRLLDRRSRASTAIPAKCSARRRRRARRPCSRGGLKVYTAYDPFAQLQADTAISTVLPPSTPFTASLVVIDNHDGGVRAIANGRTFAQMQFDPATEGPGRQAGSAFKTFTLAAALSHGYSPNDSVSGGSISLAARARLRSDAVLQPPRRLPRRTRRR